MHMHVVFNMYSCNISIAPGPQRLSLVTPDAFFLTSFSRNNFAKNGLART
jgi:hypothetical protein